MKLSNAAFASGAQIPAKYTCRGPDVSPPLAWSDGPPSVQSFAVIADGPDAPGGT